MKKKKKRREKKWQRKEKKMKCGGCDSGKKASIWGNREDEIFMNGLIHSRALGSMVSLK